MRPEEKAFKAHRCYCGLEMSQTIPYEVLAIDDLIDTNFTPQGMPGYLNRDVKIGDRILSIDGQIGRASGWVGVYLSV